MNNDIFTSIFSYLLKEDRDKIAQPNLIIGEKREWKDLITQKDVFQYREQCQMA